MTMSIYNLTLHWWSSFNPAHGGHRGLLGGVSFLAGYWVGER